MSASIMELQKVHGYVADGFPKVESARHLARYELRPEQVEVQFASQVSI